MGDKEEKKANDTYTSRSVRVKADIDRSNMPPAVFAYTDEVVVVNNEVQLTFFSADLKDLQEIVGPSQVTQEKISEETHTIPVKAVAQIVMPVDRFFDFIGRLNTVKGIVERNSRAFHLGLEEIMKGEKK